jgi:hypothetical protein
MSTLNIPVKFKRGLYKNQEVTTESAVFLIRYMCDQLGAGDLSGDVLDIGCGTKFTQAFSTKASPWEPTSGWTCTRI